MADQNKPDVKEVEAEFDFAPPPGSDLVAKYGSQAAMAAVGLLFVVGLYVFISGKNQEEGEAAWSRFARAEDAGTFATIADDYPDHPVGIWARLAEGESYLQEALRLQTTDAKAAKAELKKAKEAFELLGKKGNLPADARIRAELCNAWLLEATCDGDTEKAISAYEGFRKNNPDSLYESYIKKRVEALKTDDAEAFYAWFPKQNPKPEDFQRPQDGFPGGFPGGMPPGHPEMPVTLPQIPDDLFPADWNDLKTGDLPEPGGDAPKTGSDGEAPKEGEGEATEVEPANEAKPTPEGDAKESSPATSEDKTSPN